MTIDDEYQEVYFCDYCKTCKYYDYAMEEEPCFECIGNAVNLYSHKPVKWEAK